jgi:sugar lactone lactonase YvrE
MENSSISPIVLSSNTLGESPIYSEELDTIYWIDIFRQEIHSFEKSSKKHFIQKLDLVPTAIRRKDSENLWLVFENGVAIYSIKNKEYRIIDSLDLPSEVRFNDANSDPNGKLWLGTMDKNCAKPIGALYFVENEKIIESEINGLIESNGICWSPEGGIMYHVDSMNYVINRYRYNIALGKIDKVETPIAIHKEHGVPDGICFDNKGSLYVAMWEGYKLLKINLVDHSQTIVELPVRNPTSLIYNQIENCFYITSANFGLENSEIEDNPLNGALLELKL